MGLYHCSLVLPHVLGKFALAARHEGLQPFVDGRVEFGSLVARQHLAHGLEGADIAVLGALGFPLLEAVRRAVQSRYSWRGPIGEVFIELATTYCASAATLRIERVLSPWLRSISAL